MPSQLGIQSALMVRLDTSPIYHVLMAQHSVLEHQRAHRRSAVPTTLTMDAANLYWIMDQEHPERPYEIIAR